MPPALLDAPSRVGPWLSVAAGSGDAACVYSPYLRATLTSESLGQTWDATASDLGAVQAFGDRLGDRALWSPHLSFSMLGGLSARSGRGAARARCSRPVRRLVRGVGSRPTAWRVA